MHRVLILVWRITFVNCNCVPNLGYLISLVITTAPIFSPWKYQHSFSRTGRLDALHNLLTNFILCKLKLWNECAQPINWMFFDWLPASSNYVSSITWEIERNRLRRFCSMFCNVIITFLGVLYCDHTGWGIWSSALFVVLHIRLMPARQHKSSLFPNKIVWSILYSFSYLHTTFVICCAIVSHFHLTVHHYVLFIWGSVSSLHPRYSIPKGQKKYHNFFLCPCSFGATESLFCPIGHNGFPLIIMINLLPFVMVRRKSCSFLNFSSGDYG